MTVNQNAKNICWKISQNNFQAVICGGAVRDMLLGKEPHDWDISTDADPDTVQWILKSWRVPTKAVGAAFGVVLAKEGDEEFEIATFRGREEAFKCKNFQPKTSE